eukprot:gene9274-10932_t
MTPFASGSAGVRVIGTTSSLTGQAVKVIGDYNNDGLPDFAVSSTAVTISGRTGCGLVIIVLGQTTAWTEVDISTVTSGQSTRRVIGAAGGDNLGTSIGRAGDVNQDGYEDILIGAGGANFGGRTDAGAIYVLFGTTSASGYTDIDLASFAASAAGGYVIYGPIASSFLGNGLLSLQAFGDVNGDSIDDFAISAPNIDLSGVTDIGAAWFIYGSTATPVDLDLASLGSAGIELVGEATTDSLGISIDNVGDFNGDGKNDTIIGAYGYTSNSLAARGAAYLIYGTGSPVSFSPIGFTVSGVAANNALGWTVSRGGDLDQDGIDDYLLGAYNGLGRVYVLYGSLTAPSADIDLATYEGKVAGYGVGYLVHGPIYPWSASPTRSPSQNPTAAPSDPSAWPTMAPSAVPSQDPTQEPSVTPTEVPSALPTITPSEIPTEHPSVSPSEIPSEMPTLVPSVNPTITPSEVPSEMPTFMPSADPTMTPSEMPSLAPSHDPSIMPSAVPSMNPSFAPSADPSTTPSHAPSEMPSLAPSVTPTTTPSAAPSANPSTAVTASPSKTPTMQPSVLPTVRPTDKPYQVVLAVQQDVYFVSKADYDSQKVQCNLTIQHTVAASMDGVVPERVTEIEVEETEAARFGNVRALTTTVLPPPVSLKYKVTVYDPVLSAEVLTAQLKAKVQSGEMDNAFRAFAVMFNATKMQNGTFSAPQITYVDQDGDSDESDSDVGLIVGVTVGGFIFLCLVILALCACHKRRKSNTTVLAAHN